MSRLRPDPDHEAVCASPGRHVVISAPPGTGKTSVSVRLAGELVPSLAGGEQVLLVTFSNQARTQLEREAALQLPIELRRAVHITNYHRFFWRAILSYRRILGIPLDAGVVSFERERLPALRTSRPNEVKHLAKQHSGLLEAFAEQAFPAFRDERTPDTAVLADLLQVVATERDAGRLVFDDFGALFWELLESYPSIEAAYKARFSVVIADEHQDASALQDAVVRRLARSRLFIFADAMQLIHGYRGARPERLARHLRESDDRHELHTPHRWHGNLEVGRWLLAVRDRLQGRIAPAKVPEGMHVDFVAGAYGYNAALPQIFAAIERARRRGATSVAVLTRRNDEATRLRRYLAGKGVKPRQVGAGEDFEEAREDIELLLTVSDPEQLARRAVDRLHGLVPTLSQTTADQIRRRLAPGGVELKQSGKEARAVLTAILPIYKSGPAAYFQAVTDAVEACSAQGHHLARIEAFVPYRETVMVLDQADIDVGAAVAVFSDRVAAAAHRAPTLGPGVFVMTAHQAKGKEFDAVVLGYTSTREYPDSDEEAKRLFYVAVTRGRLDWSVIAPDSSPSGLIDALTG